MWKIINTKKTAKTHWLFLCENGQWGDWDSSYSYTEQERYSIALDIEDGIWIREENVDNKGFF